MQLEKLSASLAVFTLHSAVHTSYYTLHTPHCTLHTTACSPQLLFLPPPDLSPGRNNLDKSRRPQLGKQTVLGTDRSHSTLYPSPSPARTYHFTHLTIFSSLSSFFASGRYTEHCTLHTAQHAAHYTLHCSAHCTQHTACLGIMEVGVRSP